MMPEPRRKSEAAQPLGNEGKEDLGSRRIKPPAGPELAVQPSGAREERTKSLSPVTRQPRLLGTGRLHIQTDFFGVCRGAEQPAASRDGARPLRELTLAPRPKQASLYKSSGAADWLAACSLLPGLMRSPTVLYNAKIIFLLPT